MILIKTASDNIIFVAEAWNHKNLGRAIKWSESRALSM